MRRPLLGVVLATVAAVLGACGDDGTATPNDPSDETLDLSAPGWHELPPGPLAERSVGVRVWTGDRLVLWGGTTEDHHDPAWASRPQRTLADGATLDLRDGSWIPMADSPFPDGLYQPLGAWDGEQVVIIGTECDPIVPEVTVGTPPECPGGPAAAAWSPSTEQWRRLPDPPIPVDPDYNSRILTDWRAAIGGQGTTLFGFGRAGTTIRWHGDDERWTQIEVPWGNDAEVALCADPIASLLVAAPIGTSADGPRAWSLGVEDPQWSGPVEIGLTVDGQISCGDGRLVVDRYDNTGSRAVQIDLATGDRSPAFDATAQDELRHVHAVGPWLFSHGLTGAIQNIETTRTVRRVDGGRWQPFDEQRQPGEGATWVGDGLIDGQVGAPDDAALAFWRPPPELAD